MNLSFQIRRETSGAASTTLLACRNSAELAAAREERAAGQRISTGVPMQFRNLPLRGRLLLPINFYLGVDRHQKFSGHERREDVAKAVLCCSHLILYIRTHQTQPLREVAHTGSRARRAFGQEFSPHGAQQVQGRITASSEGLSARHRADALTIVRVVRL